MNAVRSGLVPALLLAALRQEIVAASAVEYCPDTQSEIQTARPDVTNSSVVVPNGSLQAENGINLTARRATRTIDGTNTRIRLGVARCIELLADLPDYFRSIHGGRPITPLNVTASNPAGTSAVAIAGRHGELLTSS